MDPRVFRGDHQRTANRQRPSTTGGRCARCCSRCTNGEGRRAAAEPVSKTHGCTLVQAEAVAFPAFRVSASAASSHGWFARSQPAHSDHVAEWPPGSRWPCRCFVPQVDEDGNERAGIICRTSPCARKPPPDGTSEPEIARPTRSSRYGIVDPVSATRAARAAARDPAPVDRGALRLARRLPHSAWRRRPTRSSSAAT